MQGNPEVQIVSISWGGFDDFFTFLPCFSNFCASHFFWYFSIFFTFFRFFQKFKILTISNFRWYFSNLYLNRHASLVECIWLIDQKVSQTLSKMSFPCYDFIHKLMIKLNFFLSFFFDFFQKFCQKNWKSCSKRYFWRFFNHRKF
jgi:hypothetical protein